MAASESEVNARRPLRTLRVEGWVSLLSKRMLKRGVHRSTQALERDINNFIAAHNESPTPFVWKKSADEILASLKRYCEVANGRESRETL